MDENKKSPADAPEKAAGAVLRTIAVVLVVVLGIIAGGIFLTLPPPSLDANAVYQNF